MTVKLTKVDGGYQLFIPDELASQVGFAEGVAIEADVLAEMLVLKQPEFVTAARAAIYSQITPDTLHGETDWGTPVGRERIAE